MRLGGSCGMRDLKSG
ncbi:hypothetical protein AYI70_g10540, partial [Smittium culicis]